MTEQEKREKVIKGLECCLGKGQKRGMCEDCPYNTGRMKCNLGDMHVDAIALLKALDVTPEELERLKKCRHECKIDCLLEHYERIKDERDALLKARLPRVLKLEELLSICEEPVWLEPKSGKSYTGWVLIDNIREGAEGTDIKLCMTRPGRVMVCPNIDLYGIKWRCWTSRPTVGQREAVKWG